MSNAGVTLDASAAVAITAQAEKRKRWFELGLVLLIAIGGSTLYSISVLKNGLTPQSSVSTVRWAVLVLQEGAALLLLGYVLSRRRLTLSSIGLRWSPMDAGMGAILAFISYEAYRLGYAIIRTFHHAMLGTESTASVVFGHPPLVMAIVFCVLNPFFEELIVRSYLMTEIIELTGSKALAVSLSVAVQFSYHLYYGWAGAIALSFQFLIYALYFAYGRRALPIVVAHGFFDVYGMIRLFGLPL